jgi:hypothetical protein
MAPPLSSMDVVKVTKGLIALRQLHVCSIPHSKAILVKLGEIQDTFATPSGIKREWYVRIFRMLNGTEQKNIIYPFLPWMS